MLFEVTVFFGNMYLLMEKRYRCKIDGGSSGVRTRAEIGIYTQRKLNKREYVSRSFRVVQRLFRSGKLENVKKKQLTVLFVP